MGNQKLWIFWSFFFISFGPSVSASVSTTEPPCSPSSSFLIENPKNIPPKPRKSAPQSRDLAWGNSLSTSTDMPGAAAILRDYVVPADPDPNFCSEWNPEFALRGYHCCAKWNPVNLKHRRGRRSLQCPRERSKTSYCDEMTPEQKRYSALGYDGRLGDMLQLITHELGRDGDQAYCTVNDGFLAYGRRIIPSSFNRIMIRHPKRCVDFGTDAMVGMLEWVGRQVDTGFKAPEYKGVHLLLGDISAPRGGCLTGKSGHLGHASHTTGQDADVGFLTANSKQPSPDSFHKRFQPDMNWWLLKQIFHNPFACVKVVFLDRHWINKLAKVAWKDPEWKEYRRFIRHAKAHQNHMHVRIGETPGRPGCVPNPRPEFEIPDGSTEDGGDEGPGGDIMQRVSLPQLPNPLISSQ